MVKKYIEDSRTIILAVVPCNHDIATQEILKLATEVDPEGVRTMGVLTKPDLVPERAMQQMVCELVQGRRQPLRLGYYVVKNRGSDDQGCSRAKNQQDEMKFFAKMPWVGLQSTGKVGTPALSTALTRLLQGITKKEFKNVTADIQHLLDSNLQQNKTLGEARTTSASQRQYLGKLSVDFQNIVMAAKQANYSNGAFPPRSCLRLITIMRQMNDEFKVRCWDWGHTWEFEDPWSTLTGTVRKEHKVMAKNETLHRDLDDIVRELDYECPQPLNSKSLRTHIKTMHKDSRGPELGTVSYSSTLDADHSPDH